MLYTLLLRRAAFRHGRADLSKYLPNDTPRPTVADQIFISTRRKYFRTKIFVSIPCNIYVLNKHVRYYALPALRVSIYKKIGKTLNETAILFFKHIFKHYEYHNLIRIHVREV